MVLDASDRSTSMPVQSALPLGVLEAAWFEKSHLSDKPLFDLLSVIFTDKHDQYAYERFVGKRHSMKCTAFCAHGRI